MQMLENYSFFFKSFYIGAELIYSLLLVSKQQSGSGEGHGSPLQYSCLESPMDGGAW